MTYNKNALGDALDYVSGHYLGLKLTDEQDARLQDIAMELINWWPKEAYPVQKEEVFSLLIILGYHMEHTVYKNLNKKL